MTKSKQTITRDKNTDWIKENKKWKISLKIQLFIS